MMLKRLKMLGSTMILSTLLMPLVCLAARDLGSAADAAVSQATIIAKALSVLGIICGAAIYQIPGASMFARGTIIAGLIGAGLSFGGPSLIALIRMIFGA
jgi:hypothetical protein